MNKRQLLLLGLCLGLIPFQAALTIRLLPFYAVRLGADPATTGLFVAFAFLAVTLGNMAGGLPFSVVFDADGRIRQRRMGRVSEADLKAWSAPS